MDRDRDNKTGRAGLCIGCGCMGEESRCVDWCRG